MDYEKTREGILLRDAGDFEPEHIFECGQCFRWYLREDGSYKGVAKGKSLEVRKSKEGILLKGTGENDFESIWKEYFDLDRDYGKIKKRLSEDEVLEEAVKFGYGIRILKQDIWETLISFIISANNRIPRIKRTIANLCGCFGERLELDGEIYFDFPTPERIASLSEGDIRLCGCGFRSKYITDTARKVVNGEIDLYGIENLETEEARQKLMQFQGVGPKVADCILLFSMQKFDAFPVDVWVKRVMEHFYLKQDTSLRDIQKYASEKFGDLAGFAQQYLFYYIRETTGRDFRE